MQIDIHGALRDLERLVDRIAELIEWHKLAQQERRFPFSTSFDLNDHLADEMRSLYISFGQADIKLRDLLSRSSLGVSEAQRLAWLRELAQLESQAAKLACSATFKNS